MHNIDPFYRPSTHESTHAQRCGKFNRNKCFDDQFFGVNKAGGSSRSPAPSFCQTFKHFISQYDCRVSGVFLGDFDLHWSKMQPAIYIKNKRVLE